MQQNESKCIIYNTYTVMYHEMPKIIFVIAGHHEHSDSISIFGLVSFGFYWFRLVWFRFRFAFSGTYIIRILG